MSNELDNFDDLFEELQFELDDPETAPADGGAKPEKKNEPEITFKVPESEEDFLRSFGDEDDEIEEEEGEKKPEGSEEEEEGAEEEQDDDDDTSDYFKAVGEGLFKLGKFGDIPKDFKWTEESFLEKFEELAEKNAKTRINDLLTDSWGEIGIQMFNDIFVKKVPVKDYLTAYSEAEDFNSIDLDKVGNQRLVVKAYLESMGVDEDEIYEQIELLEEKEKLQERAEKYKDKLVEERVAKMREMSQKREAAISAQKRAEKERFDAISEVVKEALEAKEINGIPLSVADNKELLRFVAAPAYKLQNGQEITELEKKLIEIKKDPLKWVALGKLIKEDLNVTPIKKKGEDEKKGQVFEFVKNKKAPKQTEIHNQLDLLFKRKK